jgi:hypothetical protein
MPLSAGSGLADLNQAAILSLAGILGFSPALS